MKNKKIKTLKTQKGPSMFFVWTFAVALAAGVVFPKQGVQAETVPVVVSYQSCCDDSNGNGACNSSPGCVDISGTMYSYNVFLNRSRYEAGSLMTVNYTAWAKNAFRAYDDLNWITGGTLTGTVNGVSKELFNGVPNNVFDWGKNTKSVTFDVGPIPGNFNAFFHGVSVPFPPSSSSFENVPALVSGVGDVSLPYSVYVNGTCGTANGAALTAAPTTGLCASGSPTATGAWSWACLGANGGSAAWCSAAPAVPANNCSRCSAIFGYAQENFKSFDAACSTVDSAIEYTNVCACGVKQSIYASFSAACAPLLPVPGSCGADHGQNLAAAPTNLCATGTPSAVTGSGPWAWSCAGINGGYNVSCNAQKACVPDNSCQANTCTGNNCSDSCGNIYVGTKTDGICCVDSAWTPNLSDSCTNESVLQTSNCNRTRTLPGTKSCVQYGNWTEVAP